MAVNILGQLGHIVSPSDDTRCPACMGKSVSSFVLIGWAGLAAAQTALKRPGTRVLWACCYRAVGSNGRPISGAVSYVRLSNDAHGTSNGSQSQSALPLVAQRVQSTVSLHSQRVTSCLVVDVFTPISA